jgi:ribose 5-phosphate isomerase B
MPEDMAIGIACDHAGFELKSELADRLRKAGFEVADFGAKQAAPEDDYPDYVVPLARAVASEAVARGIAICGSGVGACIAANKVRGARACLCSDVFSTRQGVEDDDMDVLCLGARVLQSDLAWKLVEVFLHARFSGLDRHRRRLNKIRALEEGVRGGSAGITTDDDLNRLSAETPP